jgi:hypothetical protein
MLSGAKHLPFLVENKQKQIPNFARDDIVGAFLIGLLGILARRHALERGRPSRFHTGYCEKTMDSFTGPSKPDSRSGVSARNGL